MNRLLGVKQCAIACISNVQCANNSNVQCANNSSVNVMARTALFSFDRARIATIILVGGVHLL